MDYKISLVDKEDMFSESEPVGLLHEVPEADAWIVKDANARYSKALNEFVDSFTSEGIALYAISRTGGEEFGPFDMWLTHPNFIVDLDAIVFPDVVHAVFDHRIDGKYVRLSPVRGSRIFNLFR